MEIAGREAVGQIGIVRWIPHLVVNAIQDAGEHRCPGLQHVLQSATVARGQDLASVGRADGRDLIGVTDARFQERNLAIVLDPIRREGFVRQTELRKVLSREDALVGQIVHGQHACGPRRVHPR